MSLPFPPMQPKAIPEERPCQACGEVFLVGGAENGKRNRKFCSQTCAGLAKRNSNGRTARTLTEVQAAYLAGVVDSDGHLGLYGRKSSTTTNVTYRPHLSVANTDLPLLTWIHGAAGVGSIGVQNRGTERRKPSWNWSCVSGAAVSVVRQIIPFMLVKRERAHLLTEFWERCQEPALKADKSWQLEFRENMLKLNSRGPAGWGGH